MVDKRALIVDDDPSNCAIWELVLNDRGYAVQTAGDLASGYEAVDGAISLFLVDYHLPDGPGSHLIAYIKENLPESIILVVSMDDDADVIREAIRAGGNIFIVKPASPTVMNQILTEIENGTLDTNVRQLINRNGRRSYAA